MAGNLAGKRVAIVATDGFEQSELAEPRRALEAAGAKTEIISLRAGSIRGWKEKNWGDTFTVDRTVGQANPDRLVAEDLIAEGALFSSGRPVLVVPYIQKGPLKLDRVMVCWDASRNAARAIADAMPLLKRAKSIDVVIVASERLKSDEIPGADIGQHLARHDLKVEVKRQTLRAQGKSGPLPVFRATASCSAWPKSPQLSLIAGMSSAYGCGSSRWR